MKNIFVLILKQFAFWIFFFAFQRTIFLGYHSDKLVEIDFITILQSFWYAIRIDLSAASYIMVIPFVLLMIQSFMVKLFYTKFITIYTISLVFIFSIMNIADLGLFEEWETKLNMRDLDYLTHPKDAALAVSDAPLLIFSLIFCFNC